jgi:hypothetical protein
MQNELLFNSIAVALMIAAFAGAQPTTVSSGTRLSSGWPQLEQGQGSATVEQDVSIPSSDRQHLLHISCTRTAPPGEGRAGATSSTPIPVQQGQWFDVTFDGMTESRSVGLVFSLETADGKVLARTTLPEIGRRGRGPGPGLSAATAPTQPTWSKYTVALHARGSAPAAHLTSTPIEPTSVWLDGITVTPRQ